MYAEVWDTVPSREGGGGLQATFRGGTTLVKTLVGHKRTVTSVQIETSSGHLLSCGMDGILNVWDYAKVSLPLPLSLIHPLILPHTRARMLTLSLSL